MISSRRRRKNLLLQVLVSHGKIERYKCVSDSWSFVDDMDESVMHVLLAC